MTILSNSKKLHNSPIISNIKKFSDVAWAREFAGFRRMVVLEAALGG